MCLFFVLLLFVVAFVQHRHSKSFTKQRHLHSVSREKKSPWPNPPADDQDPKNGSTNSANSTTAVVFIVMSFGAVGDGIKDDTGAVNKAWDVACQSQSSAMLLLLRQYSFIIQATTFSGPCKNGLLVFQVIILLY